MWTSLQTLTKDSSRPKEPERRSAIGKPQPLGPGLHLFLLIFIDVYFSFTSSFHHHPGFASPFVLRLPPAVSTLPSSPNVKNLVARGRASEKERGWWRAQNWFDLSLLTNFFCFLGHSLLALFFRNWVSDCVLWGQINEFSAGARFAPTVHSCARRKRFEWNAGAARRSFYLGLDVNMNGICLPP